MGHFFQNYCKDYENIENYEKALADNFKGWECHHRLETHNSDGERRLVDITKKELKALGMYWHRPSSELIFMKHGEHSRLHMKGNKYALGCKRSEEAKNKMREAKKGKQFSEEHKKKLREAHKGKPKSEEHKKKLSEANKGKPKSEETRKKMREAKKGMHFFNNGKINIRAKECPDGFTPGRLRK